MTLYKADIGTRARTLLCGTASGVVGISMGVASLEGLSIELPVNAGGHCWMSMWSPLR